jgi:hypothetical protein
LSMASWRNRDFCITPRSSFDALLGAGYPTQSTTILYYRKDPLQENEQCQTFAKVYCLLVPGRYEILIRGLTRHNFVGPFGSGTKGEMAMTEAAGGGRRAEIERRLIERSLEDESLRQRLLEDPQGTLEEELGSTLPEGIEIKTVQESADTIYLVLPSSSPVGEGGELSDQELETVAGGWDLKGTCEYTESTSAC